MFIFEATTLNKLRSDQRKRAQELRQCDTTAWVCLSNEAHNFVLDIQNQRKKKKLKQASKDVVINKILETAARVGLEIID